MLALGWAAVAGRNRGFHVCWAARISCAALDRCSYDSEHTSAPQLQLGLNPTGSPMLGLMNSFLANRLQNYRHLSSHANVKESSGNGENATDFSKVKASTQTDNTEDHNDGSDDDLVSEADSSSDEESVKDNPDELVYTELVEDEKAKSGKKPNLKLAKALINAAADTSVSSILDKLVEEGCTFKRFNISAAMVKLLNRSLFQKALQLAEWAEAKKCMDLVEKDYACRVHLIAKVQGLGMAEEYIKTIPKEFQTEAVYNTLLANCVSARKLKKAEEIFNKIRDLGLPLTAFACNQLLRMYNWFSKKKMANVLVLMENKNITPTLATYKVLIDAKANSNGIEGMEQTIEHMKASGVEPDQYFQARVAGHYIIAGHKEKAERLVRDIEGNDIEKNRAARSLVLPLYAFLDKEEDVARVWNMCKESPSRNQCVAGIKAWGKLGHLDKAEEAFEIMHKTFKRLSAKCYNALLTVYAKSGNFTKVKEQLSRMSRDGCKIGPITWHILVKMHLTVGEVEKADSVLQKAIEESSQTPIYSSYLSVLEEYGKRGDIDNAEKIFGKMRMARYIGLIGMYQSLLEAYVVAKVPAHGFRERLKADKVFPGKVLTGQLNTVDSYKKTRVQESLDWV